MATGQATCYRLLPKAALQHAVTGAVADAGELWHWGHSAERLASLAEVHITTARRWKTGKRPRPSLMKLARIVLAGELDQLGPTWRGWKIRNGELVSPEGWTFTPGEVRAIRLLEAKIARLEADRRLELQADWVSDRWVAPKKR